MIRTVLAVVAGYAVISVLVFASETSVQVLGGGRQNVAFVNLLVALPCGAIGGYVAAHLARDRGMAATIALSVLALLMGGLTLWLGRGRQPAWYWCLLLLLLPAGVYYGGIRRQRQTA